MYKKQLYNPTIKAVFEDVFEEKVPAWGGVNGGGSITAGLRLCGEWWSQEVSIRGARTAGGGMVVEQISEEGGGLVVQGFIGKEKEFESCRLWDEEPVGVLEDRG